MEVLSSTCYTWYQVSIYDLLKYFCFVNIFLLKMLLTIDLALWKDAISSRYLTVAYILGLFCGKKKEHFIYWLNDKRAGAELPMPICQTLYRVLGSLVNRADCLWVTLKFEVGKKNRLSVK
jgi:hypothetical protein